MTKREEKTKQAQKTIQKLIAAVDANPYDPQAYYQLGVALTEMKSYPQAEELFKRALNVFSKQPQKQSLLHYGLGNVFYASGFYPEAIQEFQAVTDDKLAFDALIMLAQTNYAQEKYQACLAFALTALDKQANSVEALKLMADSFMALGRFADAETYYQKLLQIDSTNVAALFQLGLTKMFLGKESQDIFAKVKAQDEAYYQKMQTRLQEAETFVTKTNPKHKAGD